MILYRVVAYRSRTICRVYCLNDVYDKPMMWGPWKTLKRAKRERAMLNKERCQTIDIDGNVKMVDEWTALLCATLTGLSETNIDAIVYNARDACSRSLADWWERHQAWDKKREEDEKEKNSTVTLDELRKLGASAKWLEPFEATFGTSAKLTARYRTAAHSAAQQVSA